jgi:hypothetical protein
MSIKITNCHIINYNKSIDLSSENIELNGLLITDAIECGMYFGSFYELVAYGRFMASSMAEEFKVPITLDIKTKDGITKPIFSVEGIDGFHDEKTIKQLLKLKAFW